ncbi:MAG: hypothetical protein R3A78_09505 [Polyangiales bacterium]
MREAGFVACFGFTYSPRPHTPSLKFEDDVPDDVKSERLVRLRNGGGAAAGVPRLPVGKKVAVLIEGLAKRGPLEWPLGAQ